MKIISKTEVDPLDQLANQAANEQAITEQGADGQTLVADAPAAELTNTKCLMVAFEIMRTTLCSFAKVESPKQTMSNETMQPVADAVGAVLDKYQINLASVGADFMIEIKAAIVSVPVLLAIRAGLQAEIKVKQEKPAKLESAAVE